MKHFYTLIALVFLSLTSFSQQFLWANKYDVQECNEVAAIAADTNGYIFIGGVYGASPFVPYTGDAYITKTDPFGVEVWTEYFAGNLHISDVATLDESAVIVGQSNGPFVYKDISYGPEGYFFFLLKIDGDGTLQWEIFDESLYGVNASVETDKMGSLAVYSRGQYNVGDWIFIYDSEGELLDSRLLATTATMIVDMAYYDNQVYLNGILFGPSSILIDTVFIYQPPIESATFVLALNEELVALWVHVDTAFNNHDGKIVANSHGIYAYSSVLHEPFTISNVFKRFNEGGELLNEVEIPLFSNAVSHYPDLAISSDFLGLFINNDFSFDSHKVMLYDFDLNLEKEFIIDGESDLYSGKITDYKEDFMISHVYTGDLDFNDEIWLTYTGTGKNPYIARIGELVITGTPLMSDAGAAFHVHPNPADKFLNISLRNFESTPLHMSIIDLNGQEILKMKVSELSASLNISSLLPGLYLVVVTTADGGTKQQKVIVQ